MAGERTVPARVEALACPVMALNVTYRNATIPSLLGAKGKWLALPRYDAVDPKRSFGTALSRNP